MSPNEFTPFGEMLKAIYAYYGKELSPQVLKLWWGGLRLFDLETVRDALNRHVANPDSGQFVPKIADIVKMTEGTTVDTAARAWSLVDKAFREVGVYASVTFDDPITMRVISDMGGWLKWERVTEDEWVFIGKEFQKRYQGFRQRSEVPECPTHFPGIAEASNVPQGLPAPPVVLIGNVEKATAICAGEGMKRQRIAYAQPTQPRLTLAGGKAA